MATDVTALLATVGAIVAGAAAARWLMRRFGMPGVAGEILFGIAAGPSLLGWLAPNLHASLFPSANDPALTALSWIGLSLFLLVAGLETEWGQARFRHVALVAGGGLVLPLAVGVLLALAVPGWFFAANASWNGRLLLGITLTVSALPVLARILEDIGAMRKPVGAIALGAATADDIVGWMALAILAGTGGTSQLAGGILGSVVVAAILWTLGKTPVARRALANLRPEALLVPLVAAAFAAAWWTQAIGLNAVLGPFVVGVVAARHAPLRDYARIRLGDLTRALLLPFFFVISGAQADLRLMPGIGPLVVLVLVASAAKVLGCYLGGRGAGLSHRDALASGSLLNARGAVGLVVAKVGLDNGLFSAAGYALLVMFVTVTTIAAPFLFRAAYDGPPASETQRA